MTNLRLVSNQKENFLQDLGKIEINGEMVHISTEPWVEVSLLRGINKVILLNPGSFSQKVKGKAISGDVYTLENKKNIDIDGDKLVVKVESGDNEESGPNLQNRNDIYVNNDPIYDATSEKRKTTLSVGILVLLLLILSTFFGVNQKKRNEFKLESEKLFGEAKTSFERSISEAGIDKSTSRKYFIEARDISQKLKDSGYKSSELTKLIDEIHSQEALILGEKIVNLNEFLDLTLQVSGFSGDSMTSTGEEMFILDSGGKSVIQVDLSTKKAKIVAGKDKLEGVTKIASYEDKLFSLTDDGVYQINNEKTKVLEKDWDDPLMYLYSANVYLVDKLNNQIFRFSGSTQGKTLTFSNKQDWLAPGVEVDLSKVKDVVIDGSIWILSSSGKVTKFTNGNPISISMKGIVDNVTNPTSIYTNGENKNVYILDKENGRIVVLEKDGSFKMQYLSEGLKEANDLVVSEKEGKAIILTGSKLMYLTL